MGVYRTLMYPNLYPNWPMLLYGKLHSVTGYGSAGGGVPVCESSADGGLVLWGGRKQPGDTMDLRIAARCTQNQCGGGLFRTVHPRDKHDAEWKLLPISPSIGAVRVLATSLSKNAKWLATMEEAQGEAGGIMLVVRGAPQLPGDEEGDGSSYEAVDAPKQQQLPVPSASFNMQGFDTALEGVVLFSPDSMCVHALGWGLDGGGFALCQSGQDESRVWVQVPLKFDMGGRGRGRGNGREGHENERAKWSCVKLASGGGIDGGHEGRTLWRQRGWAGDCDGETLWGAKGCSSQNKPERHRWMAVLRSCEGAVSAVLVTRGQDGVSIQELQALIELNRKDMLDGDGGGTGGGAGISVGVASSGRVIAVGGLGQGADQVWMWEWNVGHRACASSSSSSSSSSLGDGANRGSASLWGTWTKTGVVSIGEGQVSRVTGVAVLGSLRRAYVIAATGSGIHVIRGPALGLGGALDRQHAADTHVHCRLGIDRACVDQKDAEYVAEWFGLGSVSPLMPLLILSPLLILVYGWPLKPGWVFSWFHPEENPTQEQVLINRPWFSPSKETIRNGVHLALTGLFAFSLFEICELAHPQPQTSTASDMCACPCPPCRIFLFLLEHPATPMCPYVWPSLQSLSNCSVTR